MSIGTDATRRTLSPMILGVLLVAIVCNSGCDNSADSIRVYTVPKEDLKQPRLAGTQQSQTEPRKMLGVIVPKDDTAWFYKLTGDVELVDEQIESFRKIVDSTQFTGPAPQWEMPEGWKNKREPGGMTYARWQHAESGLEATVTMLPVPDSYDGVEGWQDYVVMNINRWRGQLSLLDQDWPSMQSDLEEISDLSTESRTAYLVSLVGKGSGGMQPPFMSGFGGPSSPTNDATSEDRPQSAVSSQRQMLGAIVPQDDSAWFFKLTGDVSLVEEQSESFRSIVESTQFAGSEPSWKMADGWESQPGSGMTAARWQHAESGLEATVTRLGVPENSDTAGGWQEYVAQNINRWRSQLSIASQDWDVMQAELTQLTDLSTENRPAYFVSLVGEGSGAMQPSAGESQEQAGPQTTLRSESVSEAEFSFDTPEGWAEEKPQSSMRLVQFSVPGTDDGAKAELIISRAGGAIEMNMSMWLGQVGSESSEASANQVIEAATSRKVNSIDAKLYSLEGPNGKSILLTEIPQESGYSVFVKLIGPTATIKNQRENYLQFLDSLKW